MLKKPRVKTFMGCQHVKRSETLLQSAWQYLCPIFWSVWKKSRPKNSVLVVSEILRLFVNILTQYGKYSVLVKAGV